MNGEVGVLNVGAGDTKLSFDPNNPAERIRAARIVRDMIRRGYSLLIEVEENGAKVHRRALDFDESKCEYIIADFDPLIAQTADNEETDEEAISAQPPASAGITATPRLKADKPGKRGRRNIAAGSVRATAVPHIAGG